MKLISCRCSVCAPSSMAVGRRGGHTTTTPTNDDNLSPQEEEGQEKEKKKKKTSVALTRRRERQRVNICPPVSSLQFSHTTPRQKRDKMGFKCAIEWDKQATPARISAMGCVCLIRSLITPLVEASRAGPSSGRGRCLKRNLLFSDASQRAVKDDISPWF